MAASPEGGRLSVSTPSFLFDLDGTLVDSVYQHVIAWQEALTACGIPLSVWRIHRRIGMSGGLFLNALQRETGLAFDDSTLAKLSSLHEEIYLGRADSVVPLPGTRDLLAVLEANEVPFAIATSGRHSVAATGLGLLELPAGVPIVTRDLVERAKPDPDLFLAAASMLGVEPTRAFVVGDSIWDLLAAQRAGALGIGLLSGGYGPEELQAAGAYRVYHDPADLLAHLEEVGVRPAGGMPNEPKKRSQIAP
jgi:HAD superfamily hydrolase (TIGR01509 family)